MADELCEHGASAARLTSGRPVCPLCRKHEDARAEARRQTRIRRSYLSRIPDVRALAAGPDHH